ncbi:uncharacterized protein LOC111027554 [Myzus persicae]|uniref:uncharacterized protein LOC111027554 n=1 Tax=Myzus persicae TaxID=13164 RepID=UPI000B938ACE|nr:uncharacterized protein LOC111027554 [Myzus persicae]
MPAERRAIPYVCTGNIKSVHIWLLEMYMAPKDSFGNWKENVYMHKVSNACSSLKKLVGNAATSFIHGLGLKSANCPVLPGIYIANGLDPSIFEQSNMPKAFFYGTYKFHAQYSRKNENFGCQVYILEFKRP